MALKELSWVGVLGKQIGIAEDALRLIIGMVLGEHYSVIVYFTICIPQLLPRYL